ncbi:hypothetical protein LCGC14_2163980, partial [marine sediment metagenome]
NTEGKCNSGGFNCWAYTITHRFAGRYPNGFNPTIYPEALLSPLYLKKPSRILCVFMGDLFWDCPEFDPDRIIEVKTDTGFVDHDTLKAWIFNAIRYSPQHTFLFLTKQPQNLIKFSQFPDNCYVGVSATNAEMFMRACSDLEEVRAKVKYLSIEPFLDWSFNWSPSYLVNSLQRAKIKWVIIGAQTKPYKPPLKIWVDEITEACKKANIPYFLKNNLRPLMGDNLVQDMPRGVEIDH